MSLFQVALLIATFLCSLAAGFLFAFAVVVMPGIRRLDDAAYIRSFQAMDGIIQSNQPVFLLVWLGSALALILAAVLGMSHLDPAGRWLLILSTLTHLFGVQLPTITINIPLNNRLQVLDVDALDEAARKAAREGFELRWTRWNAIRTILSCLISVILIVLVFGQ